jgi:hypothetical protein
VQICPATSTYDGAYEVAESGSTLVLRVTMRAPAGLVPVQSGIPLPVPADMPISATFPIDLAAGSPTLLETSLGKVNVSFSKIRGFD